MRPWVDADRRPGHRRQSRDRPRGRARPRRPRPPHLLTARDLGAAHAAASSIDGDVFPLRLDVADAESVAAVAQGLDRLDVLVNNAGILYDTWQRPSTADLDQVREALDVNLLGAWRTSEAFLPLMAAGGRIVNVSSGAGALTGWAPARRPTGCRRRPSTRSPSSSRPTCATAASWSTPCARAGSRPTWAARRAAGRRGRGERPVGGRPARRRADRRVLPRRPAHRLVSVSRPSCRTSSTRASASSTARTPSSSCRDRPPGGHRRVTTG